MNGAGKIPENLPQVSRCVSDVSIMQRHSGTVVRSSVNKTISKVCFSHHVLPPAFSTEATPSSKLTGVFLVDVNVTDSVRLCATFVDGPDSPDNVHSSCVKTA